MYLLWSLRIAFALSLAANFWLWLGARTGLRGEQPHGEIDATAVLAPPSRSGVAKAVQSPGVITVSDAAGHSDCFGALKTLEGRKRALLARVAHDGPLNLAFRYGDPDEAGTRRLQQALDSLPDNGLEAVGSCRVGACRVIVTKPVEQRGKHSMPLMKAATEKLGLVEIAESGRRIVVETLTGKLLVEEEMYLQLK